MQRHTTKVEVVGQDESKIEKAHEALKDAREDAAKQRLQAYKNGISFHQKTRAVFTGTKIDLTKTGSEVDQDSLTIKFGSK